VEATATTPGERLVVGHQDQRSAGIGVEAKEEIDDASAGLGVEIAGRLVGEDDGRVGSEGPRDRHPLLLATRELARRVAGTLGEANAFEPGAGLGTGVLASGQLQGQHDVFQRGEGRQQLEGLKDESDSTGAQPGASVLVKCVEALAEQKHRTGASLIESGQEAEQSRFAGTGSAGDGQSLAGFDREGNLVEDDEGLPAALDPLGEAAGLDDGARGMTHRTGRVKFVFGFKGIGMHYRWFVGLWLGLLTGPAWALSCTMLIVGDSLSSGYGLAPGSGWVERLDQRLRTAAPTWRVVNASTSGDTTQNGLQRLPAALERQRPQGVLIALGGNDALRGVPPAHMQANLEKMIRAARKSGAWVLLLEAPVLPNYGKAYANAVARMFRDVAHAEKVTLVPCFVCAVGVQPGMLQADGIHPNEQAQASMLDAVWPSLQPLLRCRSR